MAKFSTLIDGTLARKTETADIGGALRTFDVRPLTPFEHASVLTAARADAKEAGVESPEDGEPIYELAREIHTLAFGVMDTDAPDSPFFDGGAAQIRASKFLTRDAIAFLYALWERWDDECSIRKGHLTNADVMAIVKEASVGNAGPFFALRPGAQWSCMRITAALLVDSQKPKWSSSAPSQPSPSPQSETP